MKIKPGLSVNETGFLFDPATGESYSLNEMGVIYFNMVSNGKSMDEIKETVLNDYNVDEITFEKSFIDFKSSLKNFRLLVNE